VPGGLLDARGPFRLESSNSLSDTIALAAGGAGSHNQARTIADDADEPTAKAKSQSHQRCDALSTRPTYPRFVHTTAGQDSSDIYVVRTDVWGRARERKEVVR
jgi:hypothetical protein